MKYTKFNDIPRFTRDGSWECDYDPKGLIRWIEQQKVEFGLDLNPDFQRGHVWTENQQIAFLEFFFQGGKTARVIYFNKPDWHNTVKDDDYNDFVIVDGKQRLEAVRRFVGNEIRLFGSYFKEYKDNVRFLNSFKLNVNDLKTKAEVLQWYLDFNSGGVVHTKEELDRVKKLLSKENK